VQGVEALVRWVHPEFGRLGPDEFVPAIEAAGLIGVLTSFVLGEALKRCRKWLDEGLRISVAVMPSLSSDQMSPGIREMPLNPASRAGASRSSNGTWMKGGPERMRPVPSITQPPCEN